jgi:cytochrome d ubiquinol oxidase subunit II
VAERLLRPEAWGLELAAVLCAVGALAALWRRRYRLARVLAPAQVGLVLIGWAVAQYPYLLVDDVTVTSAAADARTLRLLAWVLVGGAPVLGASLWLLFRVFKARKA